MKWAVGFCVFAMGLLSACQADSEFSTWPCRFAYDNALHNDATLASALLADAPGTFCTITESVQAGVKYLNFQNNQGLSSRHPETAMEQQADFVLGLNNGIIVGFQNSQLDASGNYLIVAYDVQCPNCVRNYDNYVSPHYAIQVASTGIATCKKCGKHYDLNNGGSLLDGQQGDRNLEKYAAATTGPFGHISVGTKR